MRGGCCGARSGSLDEVDAMTLIERGSILVQIMPRKYAGFTRSRGVCH